MSNKKEWCLRIKKIFTVPSTFIIIGILIGVGILCLFEPNLKAADFRVGVVSSESAEQNGKTVSDSLADSEAEISTKEENKPTMGDEESTTGDEGKTKNKISSLLSFPDITPVNVSITLLVGALVIVSLWGKEPYSKWNPFSYVQLGYWCIKVFPYVQCFLLGCFLTLKADKNPEDQIIFYFTTGIFILMVIIDVYVIYLSNCGDKGIIEEDKVRNRIKKYVLKTYRFVDLKKNVEESEYGDFYEKAEKLCGRINSNESYEFRMREHRKIYLKIFYENDFVEEVEKRKKGENTDAAEKKLKFLVNLATFYGCAMTHHEKGNKEDCDKANKRLLIDWEKDIEEIMLGDFKKILQIYAYYGMLYCACKNGIVFNETKLKIVSARDESNGYNQYFLGNEINSIVEKINDAFYVTTPNGNTGSFQISENLVEDDKEFRKGILNMLNMINDTVSKENVIDKSKIDNFITYFESSFDPDKLLIIKNSL